MQRRDHLQVLSPAAAVQELSPDILAILRPAHPSSNYSLRTYTSQKDDTAIAMVAIIMPSSDTPRTTAACVNELVDFILAEWATQQERAPISCIMSSSCMNPSLTSMALTARACQYAVPKMKKGEL
jgi:hypothetical protein